jgi:hypothetical protein
MVFFTVDWLAPFLGALSTTIFGWYKNSIEDGRWDSYDFLKLVKTLGMYILPVAFLYFGFDVNMLLTTGIVGTIDFGSQWYKTLSNRLNK